MTALDHTQDDGQLLRPDTGMLHPSPTNPRKTFDEISLQGLANSIRTQGIMQPIVVREMPEAMRLQLGTEARLEIVAGERRWRAATLIGLDTVPVLLRELTDEQVEQLQIVENLQREGLTPIEEAEGYGRLQDKGLSAQEIADQVGKTKSYIYGKLKLRALCDQVAQAAHKGQIPESTALLIARIPVSAMQLDALQAVSVRDEYTGEPMSYRQAKAHITQNYTKNLAKAIFDIHDVTLAPNAGDCANCPDLLGNQPDTDQAAGANVCTNPPCFELKRQAHNVRMLALPEDTPRVEIPHRNASGPATYTDLDTAGYRWLSSINYHSQTDGGPRQSYADWLKEHDETVPLAIHVDPVTGDADIIARITDLIAAADRIAAKRAGEEGQQRLDVAAEKSTEPPATKPPVTPHHDNQVARTSTSAEKAKPKAAPAKTREHSPLELAYAKYRCDMAMTLHAAKPLFLGGPILHILARSMANDYTQDYSSDGEAISVILGELIRLAAVSSHPNNDLDALAKALDVNAEEILNKYVPAPAGCVRPTEHGTYPTTETVSVKAGKAEVLIRLARTVEGWRYANEYKTATGGSSRAVNTRDEPYLRDLAIKMAAAEARVYIAQAHNYTQTEKKTLGKRLDSMASRELAGDGSEGSSLDDAPPARHSSYLDKVRYRHPENAQIGWTGHGRKPQWVLSWIEGGGTLEDLERTPKAEEA